MLSPLSVGGVLHALCVQEAQLARYTCACTCNMCMHMCMCMCMCRCMCMCMCMCMRMHMCRASAMYAIRHAPPLCLNSPCEGESGHASEPASGVKPTRRRERAPVQTIGLQHVYCANEHDDVLSRRACGLQSTGTRPLHAVRGAHDACGHGSCKAQHKARCNTRTAIRQSANQRAMGEAHCGRDARWCM